MAVHERDVDRLPLADRLFRRGGGRDAAVERAHVMRVHRLAISLGDLDFVDAAQVDSTVAPRLRPHLGRQAEITELLFRAQVAETGMFALRQAIGKDTVLQGPAVQILLVHEPPGRGQVSGEEGNGCSEGNLREVRLRRKVGDTMSGKRSRRARLAVRFDREGGELQLVPGARRVDFFHRGPRLGLRRQPKLQRLAGERGFADRQHAATAPKQARREAGFLLLHAQPAGMPIRQRQRPAAEEGIVRRASGGEGKRQDGEWHEEREGTGGIHEEWVKAGS